MRKLLVADLLCGAGGSSTGCARALAALGLRMELVCVNHWPIAIETHKANHPEARHYCQDISTVRFDEPTPTQVAKQSHVLISPYYGSGSGETCQSAEEPLPTVTSKGRFGMVVPITHAGGIDRALDANSDPLPTVTGANRGELAFITAQHGERPGQAPRVHDVDLPAPTIAAKGHIDLVEATPDYDILFRMLEPHELAAAMGFTSEEATYEFAGNKTEKIKQIGNAVSVAKMAACVSAIMADAAPKAKPTEVHVPVTSSGVTNVAS